MSRSLIFLDMLKRIQQLSELINLIRFGNDFKFIIYIITFF